MRIPATVKGGYINRWFEELCRVKHETLESVAIENKHRLKSHVLPSKGGVYAFWWTGKLDLIESEDCNWEFILPGPGGEPIHIKLNDDWLGLGTGLPIPMYIGKSANDISKRVGGHLRLQSERILPLGGGAEKAKRPTTTCQLRAGIEHLFPNEPDTRNIVLQNVGFSYVVQDGQEHAANRFYL